MSEQPSKIATPLTRSTAERIIDLAKRLEAVCDQFEAIFGPPPRPDLKLVDEEERQD